MLIAVDCTSSDMLRCYVLLKVSTLLPAFLLETYRCYWACHANMLTLEPRDWQAEILEHFASQEQVCEVHRASLHILSGNATTAAPFGARNSQKCNILQQHYTSRLCVFAEFPEFSFLSDSILTSWIDFKHQAIEKQGPAI